MGGEALHWNNFFQLDLFPSDSASTVAPILHPSLPVSAGKNQNTAKGYYELRLSDDEIIFVNNSETFVRFLEDVGTQSQVGVDAEFMSSSSEQKISLLQI